MGIAPPEVKKVYRSNPEAIKVHTLWRKPALVNLVTKPYKILSREALSTVFVSLSSEEPAS
jgi:hypothetical protein